MAAPMVHMDRKSEKVYFPLKSGASLVKTKPVFSFDEKWLFVCSGSVIKVFSISSGECVRELCGHRDYVTGITINPLNKLQLVSCSLDQRIIIWDYSDGVLLKEIHIESKLYALYTVKGCEVLYLLQQNTSNKKVCDLVTLPIKKFKGQPKGVCFLTNCSTDCRQTSVGPKGSYCAIVKKNELIVKSVSKSKHVKHRIDKNEKFTCVTANPNGQCIATGCEDGKIFLWYNFLSEDRAVKTMLHWHSLAVRDLCYTLDGSYLLSGGHECVLVKWHPESRYKDYMPRLGAPLNHIVCSPNNLLYAVCLNDNVVQLVTSNFDIQNVYQGLTRDHLLSKSSDPFMAGMTYDPRSEALVLNGKPGHIQFYSVHEDKQLYNLDIVCQNYISPENLDKPLEVTEVIQASFDSNGEWLATVEYWNDGVMTPEMRLKFWQFNTEKQSFVLNTSVEMPHEEKVLSLKFRPVTSTATPGMQHMAVSSSRDGKFKIWVLVDDTDIYRSNMKWTCESVGFYRNLPAGEAAFSEDGSLLAVVFGSCITVWNPENNLFKVALQNTMHQDTVRHVLFGNHGSSHCLVTTTDNTLTVWSLISCSVLWSASTQIVCLTKDPHTDCVAGFTSSNDLFVFRPVEPRPLFSHAEVSNSTILSAAFVPHSKKSLYENTTLSWESQSELYFMNRQQELLTVSLETDKKVAKKKEDVVSFEQNLPQSALSLLMSHHSNKNKPQASLNKVTRQPHQKFMKEMFSSAPHVQPSVTTLCLPFIQSLMIPSQERLKQSQEDSDDDDDLSEEEDEIRPFQTASLDSGLESDIEVDIVEAQSNAVINSSQSQTESDSDENDSTVLTRKKTKSKRKSKNVTEICEKFDKIIVFEEKISDSDLEKIFNEDFSWISSAPKT